MVKVNANLDLKTFKVLDTGRMNEDLWDLCREDLGITFVARDTFFKNEIFLDGEKTYLRVVLPYHEVLSTSNIDLLAYQHLYDRLDEVDLLEKDAIKTKLKIKIEKLKELTPN